MDLDQAAMEAQLELMTPESFEKARAIYMDGGHSKSHAKITLTTGLTSDIKKGDQILGKNSDGTQVSGKAGANYEKGDQRIKVYYTTSDIQDAYVTCRVGALIDQMMDGCFENEGDLTIDGVEYAYVYDPATDNRADRTLAGFSEQAADKMRLNCKGCPYTDFKHFYDYYGRDDYGDHWINSAFDGTRTSFSNGDADFTNLDLDARSQAVKKGSAYLNVFMYVIREWEDALDDCELDSIDNNYNSVHAWDEGVCFYSGSLEGVDGTSDGKLLHQLADKRCGNFKTCGEDGNSLSGMAKVNHDLFDLFALAQHELSTGECATARKTTKQVTAKMYIPMIQGALRYAYKVDKLSAGDVAAIEGATFAAAVLPKVHAISPEAARTIHDNMKAGASSTDSAAVKQAFETVYAGMGISCSDVGGLWFDGTNDYYEGMEPCGGTAAVSAESSAYQMKAIVPLFVSMMVLFGL